MTELVDERDLKSREQMLVRVRIPLAAPKAVSATSKLIKEE